MDELEASEDGSSDSSISEDGGSDSEDGGSDSEDGGSNSEDGGSDTEDGGSYSSIEPCCTLSSEGEGQDEWTTLEREETERGLRTPLREEEREETGWEQGVLQEGEEKEDRRAEWEGTKGDVREGARKRQCRR